MGDAVGSFVRHAAAAACLVLVLVFPCAAQGPAVEGGATTIPPAPAAPTFLSRYEFHLSAAGLSNDDPRFTWDTHFGGDMDVLDFVHGRIRLAVDYQAILGNELRAFDPNQGNYVLEPSVSWRVPFVEVAAVFHHESRHLGDRVKRQSVDWNMLGGRLLKRFEAGQTTVELEAGLAFSIQHSFTDYGRVADADVLVRRTLTPHVAVYGRGTGVLFGVDGSVPRDNQQGGRAEAGFRFAGRAGALEVFAGVERAVDAYPTERVARQWPLAGFRFVSR